MKKRSFVKLSLNHNPKFKIKLLKTKEKYLKVININNKFFKVIFDHKNRNNLINLNQSFLLTCYEGFLINEKPHKYENCPQQNQGMFYNFKIENNHLIKRISKCICFVQKFGKMKESFHKMYHYFDAKWEKSTLDSITPCSPSRKKIVEYFKKYINNYPKKVKSLYLIGNKDSGKSHILSAFANELIKQKEKDVIVIDTLTFFLKIINDKSQDFIRDQKNILKSCKVLIIENIGNEAINYFTRDFFIAEIINYRFKNKKPIFFSSKFNFFQLQKKYSQNNSEVISKKIIDQVRSFSIPIIIDKCL